MYNFITIGSALEDIFFEVEGAKLIKNNKPALDERFLAFNLDSKFDVERAHFAFGGGGINSAFCLKKLGADVLPLSAVGSDDRGKKLVKAIQSNGMAVDFIQKKDSLPTGVSLILHDAVTNEHVVFSYKGASDHVEIKEDTLDGVKTDWIYLSGLSGESWKYNLSFVSDFVYENGVKLAFNPGKQQIASRKENLGDILKRTEILILNYFEALDFTGATATNVDAGVLLKKIHSLGPKIAVVTHGIKGAYAYDGKKEYHVPAYMDVKRLDSVGAGDTFGSTFAYAMFKYGDIKKALKCAIINSAYVLTKFGAQEGILTESEIKDKINKINVEIK